MQTAHNPRWLQQHNRILVERSAHGHHTAICGSRWRGCTHAQEIVRGRCFETQNFRREHLQHGFERFDQWNVQIFCSEKHGILIGRYIKLLYIHRYYRKAEDFKKHPDRQGCWIEWPGPGGFLVRIFGAKRPETDAILAKPGQCVEIDEFCPFWVLVPRLYGRCCSSFLADCFWFLVAVVCVDASGSKVDSVTDFQFWLILGMWFGLHLKFLG